MKSTYSQSSDFVNVTILLEKPVKLAHIDGVYQKWSWEGISGESILFDKAAKKMSDDELKRAVQADYHLVDFDALTIAHKKGGLRCVNFNFKAN